MKEEERNGGQDENSCNIFPVSLISSIFLAVILYIRADYNIQAYFRLFKCIMAALKLELQLGTLRVYLKKIERIFFQRQANIFNFNTSAV